MNTNNDQSPRAGDGNLPPLPKPDFLLHWRSSRGEYAVSKPGIDSAECFTADQMRDYARAALAAAPAAAPAWQPIETAPTDGSMFLCWVSAERWSSEDGGGSGRSHDTSGVDFAWWRPPHPEGGDGYFVNCSGQMGDQQDITHWMPLPAAPAFEAPATGPEVAP